MSSNPGDPTEGARPATSKAQGNAAQARAPEPGLAGEGVPEADMLRDVVAALPYATAAYEAGSGRLLAANERFLAEFDNLPFHDRDTLLAAMPESSAGAATTAGGKSGSGTTPESTSSSGEVRSPRTGHWYSLHRATAPGGAVEMLTAIDISERIEALDSRTHQQQKLLFTSRMMSVGEMAATLAHELNQPLAAILNYVNGSLRLLEQWNGPTQVSRAMLAARVQAEHAAGIISRVREFVRSREPRRHPLDMTVIVGTVVELLRLEAERLQLRIDLALAPDLPEAFADKVMIEQVLLNLVKNAIEAMREIPSAKRSLRIEGRRTLDDEVELRVLDRGAGLSPEQQGQVFSPFFTTKTDGMGIGLAICRSIIEYHEGRLFFESRDGGGSVFGFTLPLAQRRAEG